MNHPTRIRNIVAATVAAAALAGCYTYPVYQPVAVQRLSPAQSAALSDQQLSQADRDRLARDNAQARADQPAQAQTYTYAYAPAAPVYVAPATFYDPYWYGYPGFYGAYPFYPSIGLSFGFGGRWGGHGYHGGFRGHR